jgi:stage V sporulation protein G
MNITDVRLKLMNDMGDENSLLATVSITIDGCFVVHKIGIRRRGSGYLVTMPSEQMADGSHRDIAHPINAEARAEVERRVIAKYEQEVKERNSASAV